MGNNRVGDDELAADVFCGLLSKLLKSAVWGIAGMMDAAAVMVCWSSRRILGLQNSAGNTW